MKKKFIILIVALMLLTIVKVNAQTNFVGRAPGRIPAASTVMSSITDNTFDYSKISFSSKDDSGNITGSSSIRKVALISSSTGLKIISDFSENMTAASPKTFIQLVSQNLTEDNWFTTYSLDANLKYPLLSIINNPNAETLFASISNTAIHQTMFDSLLEAAFFNDVNHYDIVKGASLNASTVTFDYTINDDLTATQAIQEKLFSQQTVGVKIKSITIDNGTPYVIKPDSNGVLTTDSTKFNDSNVYNYEFNFNNIFFDKFNTTKIDSTNSKSYAKALWIAENTYPTYDLETALTMAGVDVTTLYTEIGTLESTIPSATDPNFIKLVENYVYATVQYAIWNIMDEINLGNQLIGSTQLNVLYQDLITNAVDTRVNYSEGFDIVSPVNELKNQTKDYYIYGPYKVTHNLMSVGTIKLAIANSDKSGISIVDKDGNAISTVTTETEFYIKTMKSAKAATVKLKIYTDDGKTIAPDLNKSRIYYSNNALASNMVSPAKITTGTISTTLDLNYNPKTGVENVAVIFVITLVAFSLGYLALSYKNKPIELN